MAITPRLQCINKNQIEIAMQSAMLKTIVQQQHITTKLGNRLASRIHSVPLLKMPHTPGFCQSQIR